jgi:hypothetical protein
MKIPTLILLCIYGLSRAQNTAREAVAEQTRVVATAHDAAVEQMRRVVKMVVIDAKANESKPVIRDGRCWQRVARGQRWSFSFGKLAASGGDDIQNVAETYKVGNPIVVRLNDGRIVEAKIRAVVEQTNGLHLQVDYGNDETALVHEKQVRKEP